MRSRTALQSVRDRLRRLNVPISVIVGGQFGSEGKGKVAQYLAAQRAAAAVVRIGGSNSGHTGFTTDGEPEVLRHLPTAALLPETRCVLGAGTYVDPDILLEEIMRVGLAPERLLIDEKAMIVTEADKEAELAVGLPDRIGSTGSGTGASVARRVARGFDTPTVRDVPALRPYLGDASAALRDLLNAHARVIIEGTQGFGLSVLHSPAFPHTTSRDTSAAGALSEAGLSPLDVDEVVLVIRAHPIRVGGASGPLPDEIDWETITRESGASRPLAEFTSVTGRLRRVGRFDPSIVRRAITVNRPSLIVLNHVDYVDARCQDLEALTDTARAFIAETSRDIGHRIDMAGAGRTAMVHLSGSHIRVASQG